MADKKTHHLKLFESVIVKDAGGEEISVPVNKQENKIANQFLAAQMRRYIQKTIEVYRERELNMSPKEIKDLVEAAARVAEFSGEVYKDADPIAQGEKKAEVTEATIIDFTSLKKPEEKKPE